MLLFFLIVLVKVVQIKQVNVQSSVIFRGITLRDHDQVSFYTVEGKYCILSCPTFHETATIVVVEIVFSCIYINSWLSDNMAVFKFRSGQH